MRTLYTLILGMLCLSSCARETSQDAYDSKHFGKIATTHHGIIKRKRDVTMTNKKSLKTEKAVEYLIELDNGKIQTVVQGLEPRLFEGEKVYVQESEEGHLRVTVNNIRTTSP